MDRTTYNSMCKSNEFAMQMIETTKNLRLTGKTPSLFKCPVCKDTRFVTIYREGVRGAKRCPNAVFDLEKKEYFCQLNGVTSLQAVEKENQRDLLKAIGKIGFEVKVSPTNFAKAIADFFRVTSLEELSLKQLELLLAKLKLARRFKLDLIDQNKLPQQNLTAKQMSLRVA